VTPLVAHVALHLQLVLVSLVVAASAVHVIRVILGLTRLRLLCYCQISVYFCKQRVVELPIQIIQFVHFSVMQQYAPFVIHDEFGQCVQFSLVKGFVVGGEVAVGRGVELPEQVE